MQKASLQIWVILIVVNNGLMLLTIARADKKNEKTNRVCHIVYFYFLKQHSSNAMNNG